MEMAVNFGAGQVGFNPTRLSAGNEISFGTALDTGDFEFQSNPAIRRE